MDQVHVVRHKVLVEGQPIRRVAREMGISRNTVRRYVEERSEPKRIEVSPRRRPVWEQVGARIEAILADSPRWTGGKQRLTAARLHEMLRAEGHAVGATVVKAAVAEWKRRRREVFVPLVYRPGELAEVDFFEVLVDVGEQRRKAWLFVMRLMHSGRDFGWLYDRQDQVSFLDGHVRAFEHFGAVPQRIAYDNLRAAVGRVLLGSERELAPRFRALASHYLFEPAFCRPRTGHDKGGVEARGKAIRWQHLVPIPQGESLRDMSATLLARLDARQEDVRSDDAEGRTIAALFAAERGGMLPLPEHAFAPSRVVHVTASRRALVAIDGAQYSVLSGWAQRGVVAHVGADEVRIVGPRTGDAEPAAVVHPRKRFGERSIDYRHYVRELARKPQAVRQVAPELIRDLGEPYGAAWRHLVDVHGPREAARHLAKVLAYVVTDGIETVAERLRGALERGEPLLVVAPAKLRPTVAEGVVPPHLRAVEVPSGSAADYDELLVGGVR